MSYYGKKRDVGRRRRDDLLTADANKRTPYDPRAKTGCGQNDAETRDNIYAEVRARGYPVRAGRRVGRVWVFTSTAFHPGKRTRRTVGDVSHARPLAHGPGGTAVVRSRESRPQIGIRTGRTGVRRHPRTAVALRRTGRTGVRTADASSPDNSGSLFCSPAFFRKSRKRVSVSTVYADRGTAGLGGHRTTSFYAYHRLIFTKTSFQIQ